MSLIEELHQAHRERLSRLGADKNVSVAPKQDQRLDSFTGLAKTVAELSQKVEVLQRQQVVYAEIVGKLAVTECDDKPRFNEIIEVVCEYFNVTKNDVLSERRTGELVVPRQIICYFGRQLTGMSYPQMGRRLGNRNHTTTLHAANKIQRMLPKDEVLADDISVLHLKIGARVMERRFGSNVVPIK